MKIIFLIFVFFISLPAFSFENLSGKKLLCSQTLSYADAIKSFILGFDFIDKRNAKIIYANFIPLEEWDSFLELKSTYKAKLKKIIIESQDINYKWTYFVNRESLQVFFDDDSLISNCNIIENLYNFENLNEYILSLHENKKIRLIQKLLKKNKI